MTDNKLKDMLIEKVAIAVLAGALLTTVNYCYWARQEAVQRERIVWDKKVQIYTSTAKALTNLINNLEQLYDVSGTKTKESRKKSAALKKENVGLEAELSEHFSAARAFFGVTTYDKMKIFREAYNDLVTKNPNGIKIDMGTPEYAIFSDVLNAMTEEIKK